MSTDTVENKIGKLILQCSPHLNDGINVPSVMYTVVISMIPITLWSFWAFGMRAIWVMGLSVIFTLSFEYIFSLFRKNSSESIKTAFDGSALVSGILLGLNLGPASPWWVILIGSLIAMGLGKHVFGGLGRNPFNPVLVARVFLLLSFPVQMTTWFGVNQMDKAIDPLIKLDGISSATPLGVLKEDGWNKFIDLFQNTDLFNYIIFNKGGCLGDVSIFMLLLGAFFLLYKKVITWQIPLSYIATLGIFTGIFWLIDPTKYANPIFHLATGSLVLGAFYMATDMVSSPMTFKGHLIFGFGCGLITAVIRLWGGYPEGVSFAILIMNGLVPLIDKWTKPKIFGTPTKPRKVVSK